jgi:serine/threonine protein phosphatase PrpC
MPGSKASDLRRMGRELLEKSLVDAHISLDDKIKQHLLSLTASTGAKEQYAGRSMGKWGGLNVGSTSLCCLVDSHWIAVTNTGDCRLVLAQDGFADQITDDHKPWHEKERARIEAAGGTVDGREGHQRVCGNIAMSRCFGDFEYKRNAKLPPDKQILTCVPDVSTLPRNDGDQFLIMGSDGLWDVVTNDGVVQYVQELMATGEDEGDGQTPCLHPAEVCKRICERAIEKGSRDNICVCIVELNRDLCLNKRNTVLLPEFARSILGWPMSRMEPFLWCMSLSRLYPYILNGGTDWRGILNWRSSEHIYRVLLAAEKRFVGGDKDTDNDAQQSAAGRQTLETDAASLWECVNQLRCMYAPEMVSWKPPRVAAWVEAALGGNAMAKEVGSIFVDQGCTGTELLEIDEPKLKEMGVKKLGARKKLLKALIALQEEGVKSSRALAKSHSRTDVDWVVIFSKLRQKVDKFSAVSIQDNSPMNHIVQFHQRDKLRKKFLIKAYNCREKSKLLQEQLQDIFVEIADQKSSSREGGGKTPSATSWKDIQASKAALGAQAKAAPSNPNMFDSFTLLRVFCAHLARFFLYLSFRPSVLSSGFPSVLPSVLSSVLASGFPCVLPCVLPSFLPSFRLSFLP